MATVGAHAAKKSMSQFDQPGSSSRPAARRRGADQAALVPLAIEAVFCPEDVADPFDTVEWELRTAAIKGEGGEVLFEQNELRDSRLLEPAGHERRGAASTSTARSTRPSASTASGS